MAKNKKESKMPKSDQKCAGCLGHSNKPGLFALKVKGTCMIPEFYPGDLIVVDPEAPLKNGDFVFAHKEGNVKSGLVKQLICQGDFRLLHPLNPRFKDLPVDPGIKLSKVVRRVKEY